MAVDVECLKGLAEGLQFCKMDILPCNVDHRFSPDFWGQDSLGLFFRPWDAVALCLFQKSISRADEANFLKELMRNAVQETPAILKHSEPPDGSKLTLVLSRQNIWTAFKQSFIMLRPGLQKKNRVMFIVEIAAILTLLCAIFTACAKPHTESLSYLVSLDAWLFLTVISANFVTALTE